MSKYPWDGKVVYMGEILKAPDLPWHYMPVWIMISNPLLTLFLFFSGLFFMIRNLIQKKVLELHEWMSGYLFLLPFSAVILLDSIVYDGWRHLYFTFPGMVIIAVTGLRWIINSIKSSIITRAIVAGIIIYWIFLAGVMIHFHPFENVYFNSLAGNFSDARERYDFDYWALSYKQGYEYILANDTSRHIVVQVAEPQPGTDNMLFLPDKDKTRFTITSVVELSDYYLSAYRFFHGLIPSPDAHDITRNNAIVHTVHDRKKYKLELNEKNKVAGFENDYEHGADEFHPVSIGSEKVDGRINHFEHVSNEHDFAGNFSFHAPSSLTVSSQDKKYIVASVKIRSQESFKPLFIVQVDSSKTYRWNYNLIDNPGNNIWNTYYYIAELPLILSTTDIIRVHLGISQRTSFDIDDFKIDFFAEDPDVVNAIRDQLLN
jgi:hypothetical protein